MKKISSLLIYLLLVQIIFPITKSFAHEASLKDVNALELADNSETSSDETVKIPKKDEEFAEHSKKASKFTFKDLPKHIIFRTQ